MKSSCSIIAALRSIFGIIVIATLAGTVQAQSATDGATPLGLTPGSPAGSYALSDLESVNLYNGSLNVRLPLLKVGGRGGAGYPITLHIDKKWRVEKHFEPGIGYFYYPEPSWWSEEGDGWRTFDAGRVDIRSARREQPAGYPVETLTRITFSAPDGTEYELRDQQSNGQPVSPQSGGYNRGKVFVTSDGTTATFVSDWDVRDDPTFGQGFYDDRPDGYMMLRDGTRFRVDDGKISWMRDRNGNEVEFAYDIYRRVTEVKDSLARRVTITYATTSVPYAEIKFDGFGGADRTLRIGETNLGSALRSGFTLQTELQLFPELAAAGGSNSDPTVVSYVELPDGRRFEFQYNNYHEVARIVLPTGAATEYDYAAGLTDGNASGVIGSSNKHIYRRVIERRLYPNGGSGGAYESKTTYSRSETTTTNDGYVVSETRDNAGALLGRSQHYFYGSPRLSFNQLPTAYGAWKDGREYQTEVFDTNGTTVLRRVFNTFAQRAAVSWWGGTADTAPPNDPRLGETLTTIEPSGANLVSKQTFGFDDAVPFNNQNNAKEYDFGSGTAGALLRETRTTFVTSSTYTDTSVHLRSLASQVSVYDGGGTERARSTTEYDNYGGDANHAALLGRTNISGLDATFSTSYLLRGNATGSTGYLLVNGAVTGSVSSYSQYDVAGNVVKAIDGRGYASTIEYDDCFGAPDGNARINSAPAELSGLTSFGFATKVTNPLGHIAWGQFDYYLGRPVDGEDPNGAVASGYYNDALDRPTQVRRAVGTALENQTTFAYDDTNRVITTTSDLNTHNDNVLKNQLFYDLMGRTIETRQYEGGSNYTAVKQQYDSLGRAYKNSNPYRPWQSEVAIWTTSGFDALGRVLTVTTPDSAVVTTSYSGNLVTVADQNSKQRKSVTDGLGRLKEVYEAPNDSNYNYLTSYSYDVLDNLLTVTQAGQPSARLLTIP